jgi:hypothetical protein
MFNLKPISRDAVPAALAKADRYRLLNQPRQAQSICLDVLEVDPQNKEALITLLLSLTELFTKPGSNVTIKEAREILDRIGGDYERAYYDGIIVERWAKALQSRNVPAYIVVDWINQAMSLFDKAEKVRPPGNDDALLRWNACARFITNLQKSEAISAEADSESDFGFDAPVS